MTRRCPITYESCEKKYSPNGLKLLSRKLKDLHDFPYTAQEQLQLAAQFESKISIQGVQPKLSTRLNVKKEIFEIVEKMGDYIFKPPHNLYLEVPQNEDLSMRLAKIVGIETPLHGMIYNIDDSLSYFIKRFDRAGRKRIAVEDFSQLLGYSRETKYESSMEEVAAVIDKHCSFPMLEKIKLFKLVIFNFLIGNEDMHLKNFSLIKHENNTMLSPAYDLLNTTMIINAKDEIALPIRGKKRKLSKADFLSYFGIERLQLTQSLLENELVVFEQSLAGWRTLISNSFLPSDKQDIYKSIIAERWKRLA